MTWSIMGDFHSHDFGKPVVFSHGIPFIKRRHCNTVVYCIEALERLRESEEEVQRVCCRLYPLVLLGDIIIDNFCVDISHLG